MKTSLNIIVDVSGSMSEGGKHLIARGVVRSLEQYFRLGYGCADVKLVLWRNEAQVIKWIPDEELPAEILRCRGMANAEALITLLGEQPKGKVLIITDGFWSQDDAKALKRWMKILQPDTFRIIKVGADANPHLRGTDVFTSEEIFCVLDGWLEGGCA